MSTYRPPLFDARWVEDRLERINSLQVDIARMKELAASSNVPFRGQFLALARDIELYVKRLEKAWGTGSGSS